jgi:hypothetical protein
VGGWSTPRPGRFTLGKETRYPLYRRLSGPQSRSGRVGGGWTTRKPQNRSQNGPGDLNNRYGSRGFGFVSSESRILVS